jgi:ABC-2 type transport system ATP-binding protein
MIKTQNLTKSYDGLLAVDDLTFSVEPGEVLGFLGPNGAGKSTTMRMLAGFITPTSGTGSICGHDVATDALAAKTVLGYLPEGAPTYGETLRSSNCRLRRLEGPSRMTVMDGSIRSSSPDHRKRCPFRRAGSPRPSFMTRRC